VDLVITQNVGAVAADHMEVELLYDERVFVVAATKNPWSRKRMPDPTRISEAFTAGTSSDQVTAKVALSAAITHANNAAAAEASGRIAEAFGHWDKVFNGKFPAYY
jgi:hypothetical protein